MFFAKQIRFLQVVRKNRKRDLVIKETKNFLSKKIKSYFLSLIQTVGNSGNKLVIYFPRKCTRRDIIDNRERYKIFDITKRLLHNNDLITSVNENVKNVKLNRE